MIAAALFRLDAAAIAALPTAALEPTAVAITTEIDRLEALLAQVQRRFANTPPNSQTDKESLHALS